MSVALHGPHFCRQDVIILHLSEMKHGVGLEGISSFVKLYIYIYINLYQCVSMPINANQCRSINQAHNQAIKQSINQGSKQINQRNDMK